jgi:hypothetical protein
VRLILRLPKRDQCRGGLAVRLLRVSCRQQALDGSVHDRMN